MTYIQPVDLFEKARIVELAEAECLADGFDCASEQLTTVLGMSVDRLHGGVATVMRNDPTGGFWSRVIGLGIDEPVTDQVVEDVIASCDRRGGRSICMQISPAASPEGWGEILSRHGFTPGAGWVKSLRDVSPPPPVDTDITVRILGANEALDYGSVYWKGFGFPHPDFETWMSSHVGRQNWTHFGAYDGAELVAVAAIFYWGDVGCLYGAGTLPSHRNRGAQGALIAARITEAAQRGAHLMSTETGAETPENPNPSLHNIRRMGFEDVYVRRNWNRKAEPA